MPEQVDAVTEYAIRTVARRLLELCGSTAIISGAVTWEDFADIGEQDWDRVLAAFRLLIARTGVQQEKYESAYRHLAQRAKEFDNA